MEKSTIIRVGIIATASVAVLGAAYLGIKRIKAVRKVKAYEAAQAERNNPASPEAQARARAEAEDLDVREKPASESTEETTEAATDAPADAPAADKTEDTKPSPEAK